MTSSVRKIFGLKPVRTRRIGTDKKVKGCLSGVRLATAEEAPAPEPEQAHLNGSPPPWARGNMRPRINVAWGGDRDFDFDTDDVLAAMQIENPHDREAAMWDLGFVADYGYDKYGADLITYILRSVNGDA